MSNLCTFVFVLFFYGGGLGPSLLLAGLTMLNCFLQLRIQKTSSELLYRRPYEGLILLKSLNFVAMGLQFGDKLENNESSSTSAAFNERN